jgi:DNA invertase Pin-like site-specific DNA recombinase
MRTVNYYRVSTAKQGRSGLGEEAQRAAIAAFCAARGCEHMGEFVEVESGKRDDRPELMKALHRAKVTGATLVIAKLDRLSRNVAFLAKLQDTGVKFMAVDMPEANELTIHIMAAMAQHERKAISQRTRDALTAAKARGTKLGNPDGAAAFGGSRELRANRPAPVNRDAHIAARAGGNVAAVDAIKAKAAAFASDVAPIITEIQSEGYTSLRAIAAELNARGIMTARNGKWGPQSVSDIMRAAGGPTE